MEGAGQSRPGQRALKLWVALSRAYGAVAERAKADVARHGLSGAEFGALEALHHKGPMLLSDLQKKILVSSGGITYVIDRLAEKGLATRRPCASDRRATWAELTEEGEALIARVFPEHAEALSSALAGLSAKEQAEAEKLLTKLGLHAAAEASSE